MRFDDLRELNNKLARSIDQLDRDLSGHTNSIIKDTGHWARTLNDLEATKLRAAEEFPPVFGLPYAETFRALSCIDAEIAVGQENLFGLEKGAYRGRTALPPYFDGERYASVRVLRALENAKACKDTLEQQLGSATAVPGGVSDDLRELNNKITRAITQLAGELSRYKNSIIKDTGHWTRTLNDLEATKLRAADQFPEILDPPYGETFRRLSCIDAEIAVGQENLFGLEKGAYRGRTALPPYFDGERYASRRVLRALENAKTCKDTLEVELMHPFDLKPKGQTEVGINATTPSGTDTQSASKLNAPKPLQSAYVLDGFVGRHERDYVTVGVNGSNPDSWPAGQSVLFFDVFDLFGSPAGAHAAEQASEQNLRSTGFTPVQDSSLGPGEAVFQKAGSPMSTVIDVQRGTFIMKIAGACKGCRPGRIDPALQKVAQAQLAQAVANGFPATASPPPTTTTTPPPGPAPKPITHAYRGPIDNGVYLASGGGSHIKLTVNARRVQITFGTTFEHICAGAVTHNFTGRSPTIKAVDFHPGWAFHPIDATGHFRIKVLSDVLDGQFTGATAAQGVFDPGVSGECIADHTFTLTPHGGTISVLRPPVMYDTLGHFFVKKALLPSGYDYKPSYGYAHPLVPGQHGLSWNVRTGAWYDDVTGAVVTRPIGRDPSRWQVGSAVYRLMLKAALPAGYALSGAYTATGPAGAATWDFRLQRWENTRTHAAVGPSCLTFPY
jgi:hypothetical protein